jgi:ribosomal protein S6--L-glutamate ligase
VRLLLLSRGSGIYTTRRLAETARRRGDRVRVIDPLRIELHLAPGAPSALFQRRPLPRVDVALPRIAASVQAYGLAVLDHLALLGVPLLNPAQAIAQSRNKMRMLQLLAHSGVPVPRTVMAANARELREMVALVGGPPVLIKLIAPGERPGVMVCETLQSMEAALEAVLSMGHDLLVQRYVHKKRERDLRALVVGGAVAAWVERRARPGRLLHTLARGARLRAVKVAPALDQLAVRAAAVLGLQLAAVDLLEGDEGPRVFDVHPSPGLQGLEAATGRDLAAPVIDEAARLSCR